MRSLIKLLLVTTFAGCATYGPTWSEISGSRYNRAVLNRQPTVIEKVDGYSGYVQYPIKVDPGQHEVVLQGASTWPGGVQLRVMNLTLEPCKRYYLNAQFEAPGQPRWEPVIDYIEDIGGCPYRALP